MNTTRVYLLNVKEHLLLKKSLRGGHGGQWFEGVGVICLKTMCSNLDCSARFSKMFFETYENRLSCFGFLLQEKEKEKE